MQEEKKYRYKTIYEDLKQAISNKDYASGDLLPPESHFVTTYQVDRSTVRRALKLLVDEGYVEKYPGKGTIVTNGGGAKIAKHGNESKTVGFLLASGNAISEQFYSTLFCGMESALKEVGHSIVYATLHDDDQILDLVASLNLDGVVFVSQSADKHTDDVIANDIPCVMINNFCPLMPSILSDNRQGAYLAGKYLADMGHRDILVLSGIRSHVSNQARIEGFDRAMAEAGIPIPVENRLCAQSWSWESGLQEVSAHLQNTAKRPTAIFALNDRLAFGAMQAIHQLGLRVPQDISVMGYDNLNNMHRSLLSLSTIETCVDQMALAAVASLFWQINGGRRLSTCITLPVSLVEGETVAKKN